MSSYDHKSHLYSSGQNDTEFILASVKEQEIQFERLTKELEEEHHTVANQLERCRVHSNEDTSKMSPDEDHVEESDTESKRGSFHEQDVRNSLQRDVHSYRVSSSQTLLHQDRPGDASQQNAVSHRNSPIKMSRPQTCPIDYLEQPGVHSSKEKIVYHHPVAQPRPFYANLQARETEQPPFPTYFSPPAVYQPVYTYYAQPEIPSRDTHNAYEPHQPKMYQSHYVNLQPSPITPAYHSNHDVYRGANAYHTRHPLPQHPYYQMSPAYPPAHGHHNYHFPSPHRAPPIPIKSNNIPPPLPRKAPAPPPLNSHPHQPVHHKRGVMSYGHVQSTPEPYGEVPVPPPRSKKTPESRHLSRPHGYHDNRHPSDDYPIHSNHPASPRIASTPVAHSYAPRHSSMDEPVDHHRRSQVLSSPRHANASHRDSGLHNSNEYFSFDKHPEINEVIEMLRHPSYQVVSNAAAYIQHITYGNDNMKGVIRKHGVLPLLVNLLHHHVLDVQQNACGALRNMVFGKSNDEAKLIVRNCGGASSLAHVLRTTKDQEMKELVTGVLWNLSSCEKLKMTLTDSAMPVLASKVIIFYVSMLEPTRMTQYEPHDLDMVADLTASDLTIDPHWSTVFINATGCLRNISSAGPEVRRKMRSYEGLVEALLLVVENVIGKEDVDSKGVENCMCILRNLSYRLALEVEAARVPLRDTNADQKSKDDDCWRRHKKKDKRRSKDAQALLDSSQSRNESQGSIHGVELLWQPGVVRRYLALLAETCNFGTLEAATGALQNLSAGQWVWSANIRTAVRKEKGLPMLVEFLRMDNERIVTVMCSTLRNMALDERNKQLIGKHAMQDFVNLLPEVDTGSRDTGQDFSPLDDLPPLLSQQKIAMCEAVCGALRELIAANAENATLLYNVGAVPKLIDISRISNYRYPHRVVKAAGRVLAVMWDHKNLRTILKQQGWTQYHFNLAGVPSIASIGSQVSPFSSPPLSPVEPRSFGDSQPNPAYSKVPTRPSRQSMRSSSPPALPYVPTASSRSRPNSYYHSPQPDANYVMMLKKDEGPILTDSWV